ncbi:MULTISPECIES: hypothetical protein [unclassified Nostoc]|nr:MULTISPECIES: hypothetical protein [unclassified Nostoc]MDZ8124852.1 hypothetical protein [Nostoc sp. CmiVER01]MDZ8223840.1 hypothetical protein [Nostoc sp. ChiVER01]
MLVFLWRSQSSTSTEKSGQQASHEEQRITLLLVIAPNFNAV